MMTLVPDIMPATMPLDVPTAAIKVLLLAQVPPVVASARVVLAPAHMLGVPVMAAGKGLTVTTAVALHAPRA